MGELENHDMNAMTYDDVHVDFTWEESTLVDTSQKNLYQDVMLETYRNLTFIGYIWEDHNIEEHCQNSRRHDRHERSQTGGKSIYTQERYRITDKMAWKQVSDVAAEVGSCGFTFSTSTLNQKV